MYNVTTISQDKYENTIKTVNGPFVERVTAEKFAVEAMHTGKHYNITIESVNVEMNMTGEDVNLAFALAEKDKDFVRIMKIYDRYGDTFEDEMRGLSRDVEAGDDIIMTLGTITSRYYDTPVWVVEQTAKTVCRMKYKHDNFTLLDKKQVCSVIDGFMYVAVAAWNDKKKI